MRIARELADLGYDEIAPAKAARLNVVALK
jgi:hypothetical protein